MKKLSSVFAVAAIVFALASAFTTAKVDTYGFYGNPLVQSSPVAADMIQTPLLDASSQIIEDVTTATSRAAALQLCSESSNICLAKFERNAASSHEPIANTYQSVFVEGTWAE